MTLVTVVERPEYIFRIEYCDIGKVLHQDVHTKYTPSLKRAIMSDLEKLHFWHGELLCAAPAGDTKLVRYAWSMGFRPMSVKTNIDGRDFLILRRVH